MQKNSLFRLDSSVDDAKHSRRWRDRFAIFCLISASTGALLLCPCDLPGHDAHAVLPIALAILFGGCAAAFVYRRLRHRSDITAFLKAVIAMALVVCGVYAEFAVAAYCIAWLARRGQ